jgi:hypothetical protein
MMSADIEIPQVYTLNIAGGVDLDLDNIHIKEFPGNKLQTDSIVDMGLDNIRIKEFPANPIKSEANIDMGLNNIHIKELPRIEMDTQVSIKPTRIHLPMNYTLNFGLLNMNLFSVSLCGEGMVVIEDFYRHRTETCA